MSDMVKREMDVTSLVRAAELLARGNMFPHPSDKRPLNEAEVFSIIEYGRELGMPPVVSLMNIVPVKGRLCTSASCMLGLAVNEGVKYTIQSETDTGCSILFERNGKPYLSSFTQDDARRAGLLSKDNWKNYPVAMYRARAIAQGCRFVIPDKLAGLYTPEEIGASTVEDNDMVNLTATDIHNIEKNNEGKIPEPFVALDNHLIKTGKKILGEIVNTVTDDYKIEEEPLATDNQVRAIHAVLGSIGMRSFEDLIKDHLYELDMIGINKSWNSMTRSNASNMIDPIKLNKSLIDFFAEGKYHEELMGKFNLSKKADKVKILNKMATLIESLTELPKKIGEDLTDVQLKDYFSLFLKCIYNEEMNRRQGINKEEGYVDTGRDFKNADEVVEYMNDIGFDVEPIKQSGAKSFFDQGGK